MKQKRLFYISGVGYLISSITVLLMTFGDITGKSGGKAVAFFSAILFWIFLIVAVTAQFMLRHIQKPHRQRGLLSSNILSPPTVWIAAAFVISLIVTIILSVVNLNGFILYFCIFLMLLSLEWAVLTSGKFKRKDGKLVLKIYKSKPQRSNEK